MRPIDEIKTDVSAGELAPGQAIGLVLAALHTVPNEDIPDLLRLTHWLAQRSDNAEVLTALAAALDIEELPQVLRDALQYVLTLRDRKQLEPAITELMVRIRLERVEPGPKDWKQFRRDLGKLRAAGRDDLVDRLLSGKCGMPEALSALEP